MPAFLLSAIDLRTGEGAGIQLTVLVAGLVFLSGTVLMTFNLYMTIKGRRTIEVQPPEVTAYRK